MLNRLNKLQQQKLDEARDMLRQFGIAEKNNTDISAYTFLALCKISPSDEWASASRSSMTLNKDIMRFVGENYFEYRTGSRESFRKNALNILVSFNIAILNPDNPELLTNSPNTHYSISDLCLEAVQTYGSQKWSDALAGFKLQQFPDNIPGNILMRKLSISNFKSIPQMEIELGRFNVFIGENGSGKSNILEALAALGASEENDFTFSGLADRGVRFAKPSMMLSSFLSAKTEDTINIKVDFESENDESIACALFPKDPNDIFTPWENRLREPLEALIKEELRKILSGQVKGVELDIETIYQDILKTTNDGLSKHLGNEYSRALSQFSIYDLNTKALRGMSAVESKKTPLGLNGEGLDLLISSFNPFEKDYLKECETLFKWLSEIISDTTEKNRGMGLKPGSSTSTLYFKDKFMQKQNNTLSAEVSNEGILHVLFYLSLFISTKTPQLFAIDNIETALNPRLCQKLISVLVKLVKARKKQVLITTHNPAILDGLNLHDEEQRLFVVYRSSQGHTRIRRIKTKASLADSNLKMSEMWMRGSLGGVPDNF